MNCTFGLRSRPFSVFLGRTIPVASFICFLLPAPPLSGSARAALRLSLLRGCRSHRRARSGGGTKRQNQHYSPALDGFRRRHSRATQVFSPLEIARSLLFSIDVVCLKGEERRSASHLGLGEGRAVARAGGIVRAQDALETQGDHALRKEEEKEGIERRRKGSRGGERSKHSVESFFLFEFCAARRLFFFRPRISTLFSNG